jgi:hypothetical protein
LLTLPNRKLARLARGSDLLARTDPYPKQDNSQAPDRCPAFRREEIRLLRPQPAYEHSYRLCRGSEQGRSLFVRSYNWAEFALAPSPHPLSKMYSSAARVGYTLERPCQPRHVTFNLGGEYLEYGCLNINSNGVRSEALDYSTALQRYMELVLQAADAVLKRCSKDCQVTKIRFPR